MTLFPAKRLYLPAAVMFVLVTVGACSEDPASGTEPPADNVVLRVVVDGEVPVDWTLDDLRSRVDFGEVTIDGDEQSGPLLLDVLVASGVDEWETAEVQGMSEGRVIEASLLISAADVTEGWILDVTNRGTLKLAAVDLPRRQWVRDVGEINIP